MISRRLVCALPVLAPLCPGMVLAAAGDAIAINVVIEPGEPLLGAARFTNRLLRADDASGFALDSEHAAHVTVLQRYVRRAALDDALAAVAAVVKTTQVPKRELGATGLYMTTFGGLGMANIRVTPAPELLVLQQRLATALAPYGTTGDAAAFLPEEDGAINEATVAYVRDFVAKASGNNYKPHVTVGIGNQAAVRRLVAGPFEPLRFKAQAVSVYQLGNYCTARKRLWSTAAKLP